MNKAQFTVGGPVQAGQGIYLERPADAELLTACRNNQFAYVLASRQIGKTSLMFATQQHLRQEAIQTVTIDLNEIGRTPEASKWYYGLLREMARHLNLTIDLKTWWHAEEMISETQRFTLFLREVVLHQITSPIVIFIDEIDVTLGLDFTDDFFAAIRAMHQGRAEYPAYKRLSVVLLGVATPDELINDNARTPFNIGDRIALNDFSKADCEPFQEALEARHPGYGQPYFDQIYGWTNGHPYLTQKLSQAVTKAETARPTLVKQLVNRLFIGEESQRDSNIDFVQDRVIGDSSAQEMLKIYEHLLNREFIPDNERSVAISRLKLYGLVVVRQERLQIRNRIYEGVFNPYWVLRNLREREHQETDALREELAQAQTKLSEQQAQIDQQNEQLVQAQTMLTEQQAQIDQQREQLTSYRPIYQALGRWYRHVSWVMVLLLSLIVVGSLILSRYPDENIWLGMALVWIILTAFLIRLNLKSYKEFANTQTLSLRDK